MKTSTGLTSTLKVKVTSGKWSLYSWDHILVHPKKIEQGCLRVRPDANANANAKAKAEADSSKTICRHNDVRSHHVGCKNGIY